MTELVLDGSRMESEDDFHDQIAAHPDTPKFYGRNLDALLDVLTGYYSSPVDVVWKRVDLAREVLGKRFTLILDVFGDAEEEWHAKGGRLGMDLQEPKDAT